MTSTMRRILLTTFVFVGFGVTVASQIVAAKSGIWTRGIQLTDAPVIPTVNLVPDRMVGRFNMGNGRPRLMREEGNTCGPDGCLGGMP